MTRLPQRLNSLLKNTILILLLGGATVHRCDNRLVCGVGFTGGGKTHGGTGDLGCSTSEAWLKRKWDGPGLKPNSK
jgi:hypothetical protein